MMRAKRPKVGENRRTPLRPGNRLLGLLPDDERAGIAPYLEPFQLQAGVTLLRPNVPVSHVYFIDEGLVSNVQLTENGEFIEISLIGVEGVVGAPVPFGAFAFSHETVVHVSGSCTRMKAEDLRREVLQRPGLREVLSRYFFALFSQISQSVVCNSQHRVQSRLARWLLMVSDCIGSEVLPLTHQTLSTMLGVRRSSVTDALAILSSHGVIKTYNGGVGIIDRDALNAIACECYVIVRNEFHRLLGPGIFPGQGSAFVHSDGWDEGRKVTPTAQSQRR